MPYTGTALDQLAVQIGVLLDDQSELYWTRTEKYYAIFEAMRVWGAYTSLWRTRGAITLTAGQPFYDLSVALPTLRTRTWSLSNMAQDIRYMLLENANDFGPAGMSGQIALPSILSAIGRARNRFVLDAMLPFRVNPLASGPPPAEGMCALPQDTIYVHRASWRDSSSGTYTNLWRQDAWALDHANPQWTTFAGMPFAFSVAETSPLDLQLYPIPLNEGSLELIDIESLSMDLTNPGATFTVPDEWVHGIKYGALADLFNVESQLFDPLRFQYADMRYQQAVRGAQGINTIIRLLVNGRPVPIDALAALDAAIPYWRNQSGMPFMGGVMNDFLVLAPVPDQVYGATVDVVQSAPLPTVGSSEIQLGLEDIDYIVNYATHMLTFKCGGNEFKSTFSHYDAFMGGVAKYGRINKAEIQYLGPLFDQPAKESATRPTEMAAMKGGG